MDSLSIMTKFYLSDVKIRLLYHVALSIDVIHGGRPLEGQLLTRVLPHVSCLCLVGRLLDLQS